jgi:hypothetical protein
MMMTAAPRLNRLDVFIALGIGLLAVLIYALALAPDVLYSDSGEFQTLTYTWGITHPTGYPVYLLLARIVGLIPVNTLAWRVSFFSALAAGVTISTLYLLVRHFTQQGGALLACVVLVLSYTFWSQSILAEVYTPATAFISIILLLLLMWREQPLRRHALLFVVGLLLGLGIGVHLFLVLIGPAALVFVLWGLLFGPPEERGHWGHFARLTAGGIAGLVIFYLLFAFMDARPTATSFYATTMIPSQDAWGLTEADLDSPLERFWISVSGVQWRDAMLPEDADYDEDLSIFFEEYLAREYTLPTLILAVLGALVALLRHRRAFALIAVALVVAFVAGLVYHPGDKYIFYLPVYLMIALLAGVGAGFLVTRAAALLPNALLRLLVSVVVSVVLIALCSTPLLTSRWRAIQTGESRFVTENYTYPVQNLSEPRRVAECAVSKVAEDEAYLVLNWRALYSIYYVAHVEQGRTGLAIREVRPHGTDVMTENLRTEIAAQVGVGRAVYVDEEDPVLRRSYTLTRVEGNCRDYNLFKVTLRDF